MLPTKINSAPPLESFTSLAEHQDCTPSSFFSAKPVLHFHCATARVLVSQDDASKLPMFGQAPENGVDAITNGTSEGSGVPAAIYISSEDVTLFNTTTSTGVSIPYPAISLHAIQTGEDTPQSGTPSARKLYMQLEFSDHNGGGDEEDPEILELCLLGMPDEDMQKLYDAVSNCSNLHPDPNDDGDVDMEDGGAGDSRIRFEGNVGYEGISGLPAGVQTGVSVHDFAVDGGLPPPFPGSGGWITADNVNDYFDTEGNWIGDGEPAEALGEGAGRVRGHEEIDGNDVNGDAEEDTTKRTRTD